MANEKRLIDANELNARIDGLIENRKKAGIQYQVLKAAYIAVADCDTVDAVPVVHGRWNELSAADYQCSVCGFRFTSGDPISMFQYCRCGAKMEGGNKDECG